LHLHMVMGWAFWETVWKVLPSSLLVRLLQVLTVCILRYHEPTISKTFRKKMKKKFCPRADNRPNLSDPSFRQSVACCPACGWQLRKKTNIHAHSHMQEAPHLAFSWM
jgi:hypothetical protein